MKKEIYMGHGLYKYVQEVFVHTLGKTVNASPPVPHEGVEWKIVELEGGGFIRRPFKIQKELESTDKKLLERAETHFFKGEKWEWKNES